MSKKGTRKIKKKGKWNAIEEFIKYHFYKFVIFVFGGIVTALIAKACDRIIPEQPIVVEKNPDTIHVVHVFDSFSDSTLKSSVVKIKDSIEAHLKSPVEKRTNQVHSFSKKNKNYSEEDTISDSRENKTNKLIEQNYNIQIINRKNDNQSLQEKKFNRVFSSVSFPNAKGYTINSSAPYFSLDMSPLNNTFVDFTLDFFDEELWTDIYCLSIKVCKEQGGKKILFLDTNYEVTFGRNIIRIKNIFLEDDYEIDVGFFFSKDINAKYPNFYRETRHVNNCSKVD